MYHSREEYILPGWYEEGIYYGSEMGFDGNFGGMTLGQINDLFDEANLFDIYRIIMTGIPNRTSSTVKSGGCEEGGPVSQSYAIPYQEVVRLLAITVENARLEGDGMQQEAEVFATTIGESQSTSVVWCRLDRFEIVDYGASS